VKVDPRGPSKSDRSHCPQHPPRTNLPPTCNAAFSSSSCTPGCKLQSPRIYHLSLCDTIMLSELFITAIRAQPRSANTAIAKDVGIYVHELHPTVSQKSSFKKSSAPVNALAANSTHIFAAQADKAVVHIYSREGGNQQALVSFPDRIHSLGLVGEGVLVLGTAEGRVILWEVRISPPSLLLNSIVIVSSPNFQSIFHRSLLADKSRLLLATSKQYLVSQPLNRIWSQDQKTRTSMFGPSLDCSP
jgi:hypothetical protein